MKTSFDKDAIKEAYTEVMADNNGIEWWVFMSNIDHPTAHLFTAGLLSSSKTTSWE